MTQNIYLVPAVETIPEDESLRVVHTYENGDRLVHTSGPLVEAGGMNEVRSGLSLPAVGGEALERARQTLASAPLSETGDPVRLAYVELIGPTDNAWLEILHQHGIELLRYQPFHCYLAQGTRGAFLAISNEPFVQYVTPLIPSLKAAPAVPEAGTEDVVITLVTPAAGMEQIITELDDIPGVHLADDRPAGAIGSTLRIRAKVDSSGREELLRHPRVERIDLFQVPQIEDEVANLVVAGQYSAANLPQGSYLAWMEKQGLNGSGVTIGIVDSGVEEDHPAFSGRITSLDGGRRSWHGTMVAGHAAGRYLDERDPNNFIYGVGVAPAAELLAQDFSDVTVSPARVCRETVTSTGSRNRATIQNNSWGTELRNPMDYGSLEADYDALVRNADPGGSTPRPLTICFSVGNSGSNGMTRPKAAKNLIVTGNSKSYRPQVAGEESDNINEVYTGQDASSHGSCGDRRIRPHVMAPGEWTASANYNSPAIWRVSDRITYGGGSSGASPKTAGACALLTQWWRRNNNQASPSPAMLRALIVNGAVPMDVRFGGPIPNMQQGWGRLNLANILREDVPHIYVDQSIRLRSRGESKTWHVRIGNSVEPLKITLAWTDPPGSPGSGFDLAGPSPIVNRLALRVETNNDTYLGNNFDKGWSVSYSGIHTPTEGSDNLQNIFLPAGVGSGTLRVTVTALDLTTNCLTLRPGEPQQDFALLIANGVLDSDTTPAEVVVVVDDNAGGESKQDDADDFWSATAEDNNDDSLLDSDWWDELEGQESPTDGDEDETEDEDDWGWADAWTEAGNPPTTAATEATILPERLVENKAIVLALQQGMGLLGSSDAIVVPQSGLKTESGAAPELQPLSLAGDDQDAATITRVVGRKLNEALADLLASWPQYGAAGTRRRVAILFVGSGTRVSRRDLDAMRRLAFYGDLYLLSDSEAVLSFLAQRIHLSAGVHFRLASGASELANLLVETMAEVGGSHAVSLQQLEEKTNDGLLLRYRFHVTNLDRQIVIEIEQVETAVLAVPAAPPKLWLQPPGAAPLVVTTQSGHQWITLVERGGTQKVVLDRSNESGQPWAGVWQLHLKLAPGMVERPRLRVWARSALALRLEERHSIATEAGGDAGRAGHEETLVHLSGNDGVQLSAVQLRSGIIGGTAPAIEAGGPVQINARPPRAEILRGENGEALKTEAGGSTYMTASLSTWLPLPNLGQKAIVMDLALRVSGADSAGHRFHRQVRQNIIRLVSRDRWRSLRQTRRRSPARAAVPVGEAGLSAAMVTAATPTPVASLNGSLIVKHAVAALAQPAASKNSIVLATSAVAVATVQPLAFRKPQIVLYDLKAQWVLAELPYRIVDPVPTTQTPIHAGDFLLWPDPAQNRAFFTLTSLRMSDFMLTVRRESIEGTIRTTGGTAVFNISVYASEDLSALERYRSEWTERLAQAGHGQRSWKFAPLNLRNLGGAVELPAGYVLSPPHVAASADSGSAAILVELTPLAAQAWEESLNQGRPGLLQGVCRFTAHYYAQLGERVDVREQVLAGPLGTLATTAGVGRNALHIIQPEISVEAKFVAVGDDMVERIALSLRPSGGHEPISHTFPEGGGVYALQLITPQSETLTLDWTAFVHFKPEGWPVVRHSGTMDENVWTEMIKPDSWVRPFTLVVMLLDAAGNALPANAADDNTVDANNRVYGEITFTAPYLGGAPLRASFESSSQQMVEVQFPMPPNAPPGEVKLTVISLRDGRIDMKTRTLEVDETMVLASVLHNSMIQITTNRDPATERSLEGQLFGLLNQLQGAPPPAAPRVETGGPFIYGPASHPMGAEPPTFEIDPSPNPFYVVEIATSSELFDVANFGALRTDDNYYVSIMDGSFLSEPHYWLPVAVWERLRRPGPLYYRLWTSASADEWVDWEVSTPDILCFEAPYIELVELAEPAEPNDDLRALLDYLAVSYETFAPWALRYFDRLAELLTLHNIIEAGEVLDQANFREAVREFQRGHGMSADGIPGENTLWALQVEWGRGRSLDLVQVDADTWVRPGLGNYVPQRDGFDRFLLREDLVQRYNDLRDDVSAAGGLLTSSGSFRELSAEVTAGRSATSMHYSGLALDLALPTGMRDPAVDPFVITLEENQWHVWARATGGAEHELDALTWRDGRTAIETVSGVFINFSEAAARHGFSSIRARSCFPQQYTCAEWWHFQCDALLVPWISQFGIELLSLGRYSEADLHANQGVWSNKLRIFKRGRDGWY